MMFYQRSLLLFLTAGVILVTLVIRIIVLPMLTETERSEKYGFECFTILEEVVEVLRKEIKEIDRDTKEFLATEAVIENYQERIRDLYLEDLTDDEKQEVQEIQALILSIERDGLDESYRSGKLSSNGYRFYSVFFPGSNIRSPVNFYLLSAFGSLLSVG